MENTPEDRHSANKDAKKQRKGLDLTSRLYIHGAGAKYVGAPNRGSGPIKESNAADPQRIASISESNMTPQKRVASDITLGAPNSGDMLSPSSTLPLGSSTSVARKLRQTGRSELFTNLSTNEFQGPGNLKCLEAESYLSPKAKALLDIGRHQIGYVHQRRQFNEVGEEVEGDPDLHFRGATTRKQTATFLESLDLTVNQLELLANAGFLYLRRAGDFMTRSIYNLKVCDHEEALKDPEGHFTLSAAGLTRYLPVPSPGALAESTEFIRLAQWEREVRLYKAITRIPFFAKYRVWKAFVSWKKGITRNKAKYAGDKLSSGLFFLNETLRAALLDLRIRCIEVREWGLFHYDTSQTMTLDTFISVQNEKRVTVTTQLADFSVEARRKIRSACDTVLDTFLAENAISVDSKMTFMDRCTLRAVCVQLTRFVRLADFMIRDILLDLALDSTAKLCGVFNPPANQSAAPNTAPAGAARVVRSQAAQAAQAAPGALASPVGHGFARNRVAKAASQPLLAVSVTYNVHNAEGDWLEDFDDPSMPNSLRPDPPTGAKHHLNAHAEFGPPDLTRHLSLLPSPTMVRTALRGILYDAMVVISGPPRLHTHPDFAAYTRASGEDFGAEFGRSDGSGFEGESADVDLTEVVTQHAGYKSMVTTLLHGVDSAFSAVYEFCRIFLPFCIEFKKNERIINELSYEKAADIAGHLFRYFRELSEHRGYPIRSALNLEILDLTNLSETEAANNASRPGSSSAAPHSAPSKPALPPAEDPAEAEATGYSGPYTLPVLEHIINRLNAQVKSFGTIPTMADVGVLRVDSADLKSLLVPSPLRGLASVRKLMPVIAQELSSALVEEVRSMAAVLNSTPQSIDQFVAKVHMLEKVQSRLPKLRSRETYVRALAQLMADAQWPIIDELKTQFFVLRDTLTKLESASVKMETELEADTRKYAKQLDNAIPQLKKALLGIREEMDHALISSKDANPQEVVKFIEKHAKKLEELKVRSQEYATWQAALKSPVTEIEVLEDVLEDLQTKRRLWDTILSFQQKTAAWRKVPMFAIDPEEMSKELQVFFRVSVRSENALPGNAAASQLKKQVEYFREVLPVITDLRTRHLQPRHWSDICALLGFELGPNSTCTLEELLDRNVAAHVAEISAIATRAVQEAALEELFSKRVTGVWSHLDFILNPYKESKDIFILGSVDDILAALDESLVNINTILSSRFCGPIRTEVEGYQSKLVLLSETLEEWMICQKQWVYLETIFSAEDIKRQLPEASARFAGVDRAWKSIMKRTNMNPNALVAGTVRGLKENFIRHNETLEAIQKSLEDYLETKRAAFPRFYFLSNDELLEILSQTKDPQAVQPHLRKCFDALTHLDFGLEPGSVDIFAMFSPEGERVSLRVGAPNLKARNSVESWLTDVENAMVESLRRLMKDAVGDYYQQQRRDWVLAHPAQIVATVAQITWSRRTEEALLDSDPLAAVEDWYEENVYQLQELTELVRTDLTKLQRATIVALVTTDVHARDIIEVLKNEQISTPDSFVWQQQLRYYWDDASNTCLVRQSNACIPYGYEYQGATTRLVITPLTDRCWMTITGAYHLKLGAAPAGPAGTGKTESSKDLAKAIGIQCIVFNCSDQIDYKMMGKLFSGLAQAGSWTCLDEFNRIDIEVLSVIAQQVQQLRQGLLQGHKEMMFEGRMIKLKPHCVIITMNPGYAGRTELPDNLKVQFRPVSMMVPDYALIAEIILFSEGFDDSKNLSRKMTQLYKLSSEQLSQQRHYDFGMRAVKSVLVMAGALKRANPNLTEDIVLIRAMRDSNVPKFLAQDLPLFHAIVKDLFPDVAVPDNDTGVLESAVVEELHNRGLQVVPKYTEKIIQLFETFGVRFGVVLVGPTMGGKTTAYQVLAQAMTTLRERGDPNEAYQKVTMSVLNPKCITMGELYGELNQLTQEWKDGLASSIIRSYVDDTTNDKKWTVFDGPIDALWIENMNTVLDDNMTLCLANGQRIKLKPSMRMLFEVGDLNEASPATVSRLGVVYVTPDDLGWFPLVQTWIDTRLPDQMSPGLKEHLRNLFLSLDAVFTYKAQNVKEPIPMTREQSVAIMCRLLLALFHRIGPVDPISGLHKGLDFVNRSDEQLKPLIEQLFGFAMVWTVGGTLPSDMFDKFDTFLKAGMRNTPVANIKWGPGTAYECFLDLSHPDLPWKRWSEIVPAFQYDPKQPYFAMVVPTIDTVRYSYLLSTQIGDFNPVFFTGVTGTGKTVLVQNFLEKASVPDTESEDSVGYVVTPVMINFSARTASAETQALVESKLEQKRRTQLGAPVGTRCVVFVDDVNMPAVEEYGAQPPVELLRQLVDQGGFYDRQKLMWKSIVDTVVVLAAAPPGGGRAAITPRFSRHFHILCLPTPAEEVLKSIFGAIMGSWSKPFPEDIRTLSSKVVAATIEVFNFVRDTMKPTPAKSHYTFNLRDVSKVFQGMLMIQLRECKTADTFARLWVHETFRVFHDRLINSADKAIFAKATCSLLTRYLGRSGPGWSPEDLLGAQPLLFVDFLRPPAEDSDVGPYEHAADMKRVLRALEDALDDYNATYPTQLKLVFFANAVDHVVRIKRILRQPRGNAMLVGVGGSGKTSLTRIACHMAGVDLMQIELRRGYRTENFREDLRNFMFHAALDNKPTAFLFSDTQIVQESFLEDISNLLNTGEVPGLLQPDDMAKIVDTLRPIALATGVPDTRDNLYRMFVARVRDNLHIVLTMSPVGTSFRTRCRQFPALVNCCTIDWYEPWPEDALHSVAMRFLESRDLGAEGVKEKLAALCVQIHLSVSSYSERFYAELQRRVYTTPKSYLDLINLYLAMLDEKRAELGNVREKLFLGTSKLDETNEVVVKLQADLKKLAPIIEQKAAEASVLLERASKDTVEAEKIKLVVEKEAKEVAARTAEVVAVKEDAQRDLDSALPELEKAQNALRNLDRNSIVEVRGFKQPPITVVHVLEAVCMLLGENTDWDSAKMVMGRSSFMNDLLNYDVSQQPPERMNKLKKYANDPELDPTNVLTKSVAAAALASWLRGVYAYAEVSKVVAPKQARLAEMEKEVAAAQAVLKEKEDALQKVLDQVRSLQEQADGAKQERDQLLAESKLTQDRLARAARLTVGLRDEGVRWRQSVQNYDVQIGNLVGDVVLSAAAISYLGAFTGVYREEMFKEWTNKTRELGIPLSEDPALQKTVGNPLQIQEWQIAGLPTDPVSADNAILVTRGPRWPLLIDPQEQGKNWIKNMESRNKLAITRLSNPNMLRTLEACIRTGQPLLIEDVGETIDPALDPVLQKAVFHQGGRTLIHLGDQDIDYDPKFRLYMTTKLPNPHYLPEVYIKVTVINFTVTMQGLVDQLLGAAVKKERPEVEKKKGDLIISMAKDNRQLKDLEDRVLQLLSESEGNILDDVALVDTLEESKELSTVISERLTESEKTELEINEMREVYRPLAVRGSLIYFVITDFAQVDSMYQYSLNYFTSLYNRCIDQAEKSDDIQKRLENLQNYLTFSAYTNVCRGLFEAHKLIFSFLICVSIMRNESKITTTELMTYLRIGGSFPNPHPNPYPEEISAPTWSFFGALEQNIPEFQGLCASLKEPEQWSKWRQWYTSEEPYKQPLPEGWAEKASSFRKLILIKAFREEQGIFAIRDFVAENLGPQFIRSTNVSLAEVMKDTREDVPLIFILSTGADPTGALFTHAKNVGYLSRLHIISLGQGQGDRAKALIDQASVSGDWILLQNCHLAKSWMPSLEKIVEGFRERARGPGGTGADSSGAAPVTGSSTTRSGNALHPDFRLFLTSMPAPYFPVPVLQNGVKLTNEPPKGIRANLLRSLNQIDTWTPFEECPGTFTDGTVKLLAWKKLAFGLCFFHAIVQERRMFGPLGFNVRYETNDSDLENAISILKMYLTEQPDIPWEALRYLSAVISYGGRVTDALDQRCMNAIIARYLCPDILNDDYTFSPSGVYYAPTGTATLPEYIEYASSLPVNDDPEIFGLHMNATIATQRREVGTILETILALQPRTSGAEGSEPPDEVVMQIASKLLGELPPLLTMEEAGLNTFRMTSENTMDSLAIVLSQEMARFNNLIETMRVSLVELQLATKGEVLMSDELDRMYSALLNNRVPRNWEVAAYPSLKPLASWFTDFGTRTDFMRNWLREGRPLSFWISGFFFPQGFLTGTLQQYARRYNIAIDTLAFSFHVQQETTPEELNPTMIPEDGVLIHGLFFDGAKWDGEAYSVSDSKPGEIFAPVPIIHFLPVVGYEVPPGHYSTPVYKTSARAGTLSTTGMSTNYIISIDLPTNRDPDAWVLAGAAMTTMTND